MRIECFMSEAVHEWDEDPRTEGQPMDWTIELAEGVQVTYSHMRDTLSGEHFAHYDCSRGVWFMDDGSGVFTDWVVIA